MVVFESRRVRHLVVRLERGERVRHALRRVAEEHAIGAAWVSGLGAFEWLEVCEYDQAQRRYAPARRIERCELLSLTGNVSFRDGKPFAHLHVVVSREHASGVEVIGGHLEDGAVFAAELRLDLYDDLLLTRQEDEATGLALWVDAAAPARRDEPEEPSWGEGASAAVSWGQVAEASAASEAKPAPKPAPAPSSFFERPRKKKRAFEPPAVKSPAFVPEPLPDKRKVSEDEFFEEPIPLAGDWVEHKVFGLCRVDRENDDGSLLIRLPNGRRKAIRLDVLQVEPARLDDDRRIYPLRPRRKL